MKLQARAIANNCYKYFMDLTTNGAVITDAIKYVNQKQEQINALQKLDERIERKKNDRRRDYYQQHLLIDPTFNLDFLLQ